MGVLDSVQSHSDKPIGGPEEEVGRPPSTTHGDAPLPVTQVRPGGGRKADTLGMTLSALSDEQRQALNKKAAELCEELGVSMENLEAASKYCTEMYTKVQKCLDKEDYKQAVDLAAEALKKFPKDPTLLELHRKGYVGFIGKLVRMKKPNQADLAIGKALKRHPDDLEILALQEEANKL